MKKTRIDLKVSVLCAVAVIISGLSFMTYSSKPVSAAGVAITPTPNEIALSTATDVTFTYTASNAVEATGTTYTFIASPAFGSAIAGCTVADTQADATSGGTGSFSGFTSSGAVFTTTNATTTTGRSLCVKLPSTGTAGSYGISIISSTGDFGAALVHVGDNNDVTVSAVVGPTISFNIRNLADTADTNVCDLGSVDTTTVVDLDATDDGAGECGYSLAIGTNSASGFQVTIDADAALNNAGADTMTNVTDNGTFTTGSEFYGLANVTAAAGITENSTASYTYQTDPSPIPLTPNNFISAAAPFIYTAGAPATDVTTVMHGLTVGTATETGNYDQVVTYQVTANF